MGKLRDLFKRKLIAGCWSRLGKAYVKKLDSTILLTTCLSELNINTG
jgi:hypothetical protein